MAESGRTEQIISQFLLKALHVVLGSRIPHLCDRADLYPTTSSRPKKRDRWFNLAIGDLPPSLENLNFWHRSVMDPMVIDIILSCPSDHEAVVERWVVQYDQSPSSRQPIHGSTGGGSDSSFYTRTYKKSIVLLRSIYSMLRLLPIHKAFRMLSSANQSCSFSLSYKVSSFAEPFTSEEEMKNHSFTPVETQFGQLSASVAYRPSLSEFDLDASPLFPPRIISDYVGSPAADPMRAFPSSMSSKSICATSFPLRAERSASGSVPFTRPHSWTSPPMAHHPLSSSPTQAPGFHNASSPLVSGRQVTSHNYHHWMLSSGGRKGSGNFDEYRLSPPFSASSTPSPPLYPNSPMRSRLQSETAPVSIPLPSSGRNTSHCTPNFSDPTRNFLPPPSPRSTRMDLPSQESPSDGRSFRKIEGFRSGELLSNLPSYTFQRTLKDGKDDSGRFSGILSSCGSPRIGFSRTSSRLSFQDDLDECEFPFAVDDVDTSDSQTRNTTGKDAPESSQPFMSSQKSQDAAVGVLVHMLRSAPPLRQDPSSYSSQSSKSEFGGQVGSSSYFMSRKTSDALEELQSYKEMKEMLLSQSGTKLLDSTKQI